MTRIAAIYARKSTKQEGGDDVKSVSRQIDNAKAFAIAQGWTVDDRYVFADDGISGAETTRLVAKQQLLNLIFSGRCPFEVLVMQSDDRFSRADGDEALKEMKDIDRAGIDIWFYSDGSKFKHGNFSDNISGYLKKEFNAQARRAVAEKTHEAMVSKARQGFVTGNKVFGYLNVRVEKGKVLREVNPTEAAVVQTIYEKYAHGDGFKSIARALNAKHAPSPKSQRGRPAGWDPGTVRSVLKRPLYRGIFIYNKTKKRNSKGEIHKGRKPQKPESQWITVDLPKLRIVDPRLADAVDERLNARRNAFLRTAKGKLLGRPRGTGVKHLLSGFLECECGATFEAVKRGKRTFTYVCSAARRKGPDVCSSKVAIRKEDFEPGVLRAIEGTVLHPDFIDRVLDAAFVAQPTDERDQLVEERATLRREIENLTTAIATGGDIPALAAALSERDKRLRSLDARLARPVPEALDRETLRAALMLRGAQWKDVLNGKHIAQARQVLQHVLTLPIVIRLDHDDPPPHIKRNDTRGCEETHVAADIPKATWKAETRAIGLLSGLVQNVASPTGIEPVSRP